MVNPLSTAERLSIDSERQAIMEELTTGDLDNLRSACYRLSALAENHYTANLLAPSITLIAGANGLIDQVRARTITTESQRAESGQIIQGVVEILNQRDKRSQQGEFREVTQIWTRRSPEYFAPFLNPKQQNPNVLKHLRMMTPPSGNF